MYQLTIFYLCPFPPPFFHDINPAECFNQLNIAWLRFIMGKIYNVYFKITILILLCVVFQ